MRLPYVSTARGNFSLAALPFLLRAALLRFAPFLRARVDGAGARSVSLLAAAPVCTVSARLCGRSRSSELLEQPRTEAP